MFPTEILKIGFPEMLAIIISRNVGNCNSPKYRQLSFPEMLAIKLLEMLATNVSIFSINWRRMLKTIILQKCQQLYFPELLTIITCRNLGNMIFRNVSNYSFQKCLQLVFTEILAIIIFRNISNHIFRNAGDKCSHFQKMATNVYNYNCQKCLQL